MKKSLYLLPFLFCSIATKAQSDDYNLIIGTYTNTGKSEGIYVYDFNTKTAAFRAKSITKNVINPSYLALSKDEAFVYAVNEDGDHSMVSAFSFDPVKGTMELLNKLDTKGADPCYVIADEQHVITANYSGGSIAVFGRDSAGAVTGPKQVVQHSGSSVDKERQQGPHVHQVRFSPDKKYIISNDLGTDKIYIYKYQPSDASNVLVAHDSVAVKPGIGPRHITFSKDGKYAYLLTEMGGNLNVYAYNDGKLTLLQETVIYDKDFKGETGAADLHITPNGKFLYATNRGTANSITRFAVQPNGKLIKKSEIPTQGKGPRNFAIDPTGSYLLVAHQYTNNVVIFKINKETGALTDTGKRIDVGAPVCLVFAPAG
jgi:6-phosphogluconolactonase